MHDNEYIEIEKDDISSVSAYINSIETQSLEAILTKGGKNVGAIITAEQHEWFLNQLDLHQNVEEISKRATDLSGAISLDDLKKILMNE